MLTATGGGTPPASTSSKCRRANPSLPLEEKRARQLQAHPDQFRMVDQDHPEGGNGLVVEFLARLVAVGLPGLRSRACRADLEQQADTLVQVGGWRLLGRDSRRQHQARQ